MIKTKLQKFIFFSVLAVALVLCVLALTLPKKAITVDAESLNFEQELSSQYSLGDVLTPPSAKIAYGENEYDAEVKSVTFPNGVSYNAESYVLSAPGKYFVNYIATTSKGVISCSVEFNVNANAYSVSSSNSSVYYGSIIIPTHQGKC
jgi:hypothetical protein